MSVPSLLIVSSSDFVLTKIMNESDHVSYARLYYLVISYCFLRLSLPIILGCPYNELCCENSSTSISMESCSRKIRAGNRDFFSSFFLSKAEGVKY